MNEKLIDLILECVTYCQNLKNKGINEDFEHINNEDFEHMKTIIVTMLVD